LKIPHYQGANFAPAKPVPFVTIGMYDLRYQGLSSGGEDELGQRAEYNDSKL
jgi:hypothetical protein